MYSLVSARHLSKNTKQLEVDYIYYQNGKDVIITKGHSLQRKICEVFQKTLIKSVIAVPKICKWLKKKEYIYQLLIVGKGQLIIVNLYFEVRKKCFDAKIRGIQNPLFIRRVEITVILKIPSGVCRLINFLKFPLYLPNMISNEDFKRCV